MAPDESGRDERRGNQRVLRRVGGTAGRLTPAFLRQNYLAKFVVAFVVVVILMAGVGSANYFAARETIESDTAAQLKSTAALQSSTVAGWTRSMKTHVRAAATSETVANDNEWAIRQYLFRKIRGATVVIVNIHYVDLEEGRVAVGTNPEIEGRRLDAVDRPWANAAALESLPENQASSLTGGYTVDGSRTRVAFGARVPADESKYIVVVGAVERQVDRLARPEGNHSTALLDTERGTVVTASDDWSETLDVSDLDRPRETRFYGRDSHVLGVAPVSGTEWVVVTSVPTRRAFAVSRAVGRNVMLVVLTGLVSLTLVGVVLGQLTVPPLVRLRRKAERMEAGDLDVDFRSNRTDELGQLFGAFASMRDSLQQQIRAVEAARDEAERERERTEEMNRHLVRTANEYSEIMERCADGDLTRRFEPDDENEAMEHIAEDFNEMVRELERTVGQLEAFAREVGAAGDVLQAGADSVQTASDHVAESVQTISDDAFEQKERLTSISMEIDELVVTFDEHAGRHEELDVEEPLERLDEIASMVADVAAISEQTLAETEIVAGASEEQVSELTEVSRRAADLTRYAEALRELLDEFDTEANHGLSIDEVGDDDGQSTDVDPGSREG